MVQRLISFDNEKPDLGLPDDVQARMDARYSTGGGGSGLVPDPDNPGLYMIQADSSLIPDSENPGLYLIGAL